MGDPGYDIHAEKWPEPGTLAEAIADLDFVITMPPTATESQRRYQAQMVAQNMRQRLERDPDLMEFVTGDMYYLSDGGYSRVWWCYNDAAPFLAGESLERVNEAWKVNQALVEEVKRRGRLLEASWESGETVDGSDFSDWILTLETLCADDFGVGYLPEGEWTEDQAEQEARYKDTRVRQHRLEALAEERGFTIRVSDSDDRDSRHSDAYLDFPYSRLSEVVEMLKEVGLPGDVVDVPADFPEDLAQGLAGDPLYWTVEYGGETVEGSDFSQLLEPYDEPPSVEELGFERPDPEDYPDVRHGRRVTWVTDIGDPIVKLAKRYVHGEPNNIMDQEKFNTFFREVRDGANPVFRMARGDLHRMDRGDIEESLEAEKAGRLHELGLSEPWTTGDEDADEYLKDPEEYIDEHWDEFADDERIEDEDKARAFTENAMEALVSEQEAHNSGDFGQLHMMVRDGHHRAFAALEAGEPEVFLSVSDFSSVLDEGELRSVRHQPFQSLQEPPARRLVE